MCKVLGSIQTTINTYKNEILKTRVLQKKEGRKLLELELGVGHM